MKKLISKTLIITLSILSLCFIVNFTYTQAQNFYYDYNPWDITQDKTDIAKMITKDAVKWQQTIIYKLREAFKLTGWIYEKSDKKALDYIKMIINMALWLVAFISLGLIVFAFYLMFFSEQEDGLTRAKKILKWVLIALIVMGVSYFIVSFIFYLYNITTWTWATTTINQTRML